jgi:hypothetical protein
VAAPGRRDGLAGRLAAVATVALVVGACGGRPGTSTVMPKPSKVPLAATTLAPTTTLASTTTSAAAAATPSGPLTAEERAWLHAVTRLAEKLDQVWIDASTADPTPAMRSYADRLRGCHRELARIRPPSERLQPAYETARGACAQYDKAARCFAAAATAPAGSAQERRLERSIECGVDAAIDGSSRFDDATAQAASIDDAAGEPPP